MSLQELQAKMKKAIESGDAKAIEDIAQEIVKSKGDRRKADAAAAQKEAEDLAGVRQSLAELIRQAIDETIPDLAAQLSKVKCDEFRYQAKGKLDANQTPLADSAVGLNVPVTKKASTGNGSAGKTKDEFGLSLAEVFEKFATDEDRTKLVKAEVKDEDVLKRTGKTNRGYQHNVKNEVKKRALADGLLTPSK